MKNRKLILVSLGVYIGSIIIVVLYSASTQTLFPNAIGLKLLVFGIGVAVLFLVSMNQHGGYSRASYVSPHLHNYRNYKNQSRSQEPFRTVASAIVIAGVLLTVTGVVLLKFF